MRIRGIKIQPGMIVLTRSATYVAFPYLEEVAFANITTGGWTSGISEDKVILIEAAASSGVTIHSGETLWCKEWEREITIDEIAEKFNIPVDQLRIKKG